MAPKDFTPEDSLTITRLATFGEGGAAASEVVAAEDGRYFVTNGARDTIDVFTLADGLTGTIPLADLPNFGAVTAVAVKNGLVAVSYAGADFAGAPQPGAVALFDAATLAPVGRAVVGFLPDKVIFSEDGQTIFTANEAEPGTLADPRGSVSIIEIGSGPADLLVRTVDFSAFDGQEDALREAGVRIFPGRSASADFEPEYLAIDPATGDVLVTLQENNAVARLDVATGAFTDLVSLGAVDHSLTGLDASDRDGAINIAPQPVRGLRMADAIATFQIDGQTYFATANEGDTRTEDARVADLTLDATAFPDAATLQDDANLGRLTVSTIDGDTDGDGDFDALFVFGSRSFSIFDAAGNLVFDSGDDFEQMIAQLAPERFNSDAADGAENRSDNKGPEPEAIAVGVVDGRTLAVIGFERDSGLAVYDVSDPANAQFLQYVDGVAGGDVSPETIDFIPASESETGFAQIAVAYEVSGATAVYGLTFGGAAIEVPVDGGDTPAPTPAAFDLKITEMWAGQDGDDLTADWFEITNTGAEAWVSGVDAPLFYDDDSQDPTVADAINGLDRIDPGQSAIVVIGDAADAAAFADVWSPVTTLGEVGYTDGAGLGAGGDGVALFVGGPSAATLADFAAFPAAPSGQSFDVASQSFSEAGDASGAVATLATAGASGAEPAVGSPGFDAASAPDDTFRFQLFHASDLEAGVDALNSADGFSAVLNALRAQDIGADATLTLGSGDAFIPGVFSNASVDVFGGAARGDVMILNELGFEAISLGNHDFDFGTAVLRDLIVGGEGFAGADFQYLSGNLDFSGDANLADLTVADGGALQSNAISGSVVIEQGGELIGIVSATTPLLPELSNEGGVTVAPATFDGVPTPEQLDALAAEIQADVDALLAANPGLNKVVLLSHMQQLAIEQELAGRLSHVDIIVAGGSHVLLADETDVLRAGDTAQGAFPILSFDADDRPVAVVNAGSNFEYVARLVVDFDKDGVIITESVDAAISGVYATDDAGVALLGAEDLVDPEIDAITDQLEQVIIAQDGNFFGVTDVYLNGDRGSVRTQETNLGNLTADANLAAGREVDPTVVLSLKNGGGIRAPIGELTAPGGALEPAPASPPGNPLAGRPDGGISQNAIQNALAFNNGLTLVTVTRADLVAILEHGVAASSLDDTNTQGRFPQVAGVEFSFDLTREPGDRIMSAAIVDDAGAAIEALVRNGEISGDPATEFRMVTLGFLADGGDGYPFPTGPEVNRVDITEAEDAPRDGLATFAANGSEQDALAEFLAENFPVEAPFALAETGRAEDTRIQNLAFRADAVLDGLAEDAGIVINEVVFSHTGTDNAEFIELFGAAGASLAGLSLIAVNANAAEAGQLDLRIDFAEGDVIGETGFFLVGGAEGLAAAYGVTPDVSINADTFENDSSVFALVRTDALVVTEQSGDDLVGNLTGADVIDSIAFTDGEIVPMFDAPVVGPDGAFLPAGGRRAVDGVDTDQASDFEIADFNLGPANTPTAGAVAAAPPPATNVSIMAIQGAGHTSALTGQQVVTSGIVTAVGSNGFYLQDATGDGDIATSDALFVFTGGAPDVAVGDAVAATGAVSEFVPGGAATGNLSTTQLSSVTDITILSSGNALPEAVILGAAGRAAPTENIDDDAFASFDPTTDGIDFFESLEGMRVTIDNPLVVSATNEFGEIFTVADNGAGATGLSSRDGLTIKADDFNPEKLQIDPDAAISGFDAPAVNAGAQLGDVTGVISYNFGNFEIIPTEALTIADPGALAPVIATIKGAQDRLTVASYNVLNLDINDADGDADVADGRFAAIAQQIVENLGAPDVVALQEIQDNSGSVDDGAVSASATLAALAAAIVAAGGPAYAVIDNPFIADNQNGGQPGGNIRTAYLYNPDRVDFVEGSLQTIGTQTTGGAFDGARLPLVASFGFNGETVTLVNNHFSSKGGSAPIFGVEQDFAARQEDATVNGSLDQRQAQADAVKGFVDGVLADDANANLVVLGDLNEFQFVSPVTTLDESLDNLIGTLPREEQFTFNFQGNAQVLDNMLVSTALTDGAEFEIVHVNSEFAAGDARASDHDPLLAGLRIGESRILIAGTDKTDRLVGTDGDDIIDTGAGAVDIATGGAGSDTFVFGGETSNGVREREIITDFEFGVDVLDLGDALVADIRDIGANMLIVLEGDLDTITLLGVNDPELMVA
jgi:predicted extracellular nuclease/2',3'-cyclic-nucleotide 2'-phosphodiesterase (5'-nucleotidase family)